MSYRSAFTIVLLLLLLSSGSLKGAEFCFEALSEASDGLVATISDKEHQLQRLERVQEDWGINDPTELSGISEAVSAPGSQSIMFHLLDPLDHSVLPRMASSLLGATPEFKKGTVPFSVAIRIYANVFCASTGVFAALEYQRTDSVLALMVAAAMGGWVLASFEGLPSLWEQERRYEIECDSNRVDHFLNKMNGVARLGMFDRLPPPLHNGFPGHSFSIRLQDPNSGRSWSIFVAYRGLPNRSLETLITQVFY